MNQLPENSLHIYDVTLVTSYLIGLTLKMQSLILKNAKTVSYLSLLFENKFQDILIIILIKYTLINMLCVFKKTL